MANQRRWERDELLVAFYLYSHTPFGRISQRNPEIIQIAELMQRSASSLSMKMANIASCDPRASPLQVARDSLVLLEPTKPCGKR